MNMFSKVKANMALQKGIISFVLMVGLLVSPLGNVAIARAAEGDVLAENFVPPVDAGDDGDALPVPTDPADLLGSFVPRTTPADDGDVDTSITTPVADAGDDFVPPVDESDDGELSIDTRAPQINSFVMPTKSLNRTHLPIGTFFEIQFDEELSTSTPPSLVFESSASTTLVVTHGEWVHERATYRVHVRIVDTGLSLKDIDVTVGSAYDLAGNMSAPRTYTDLLSVDLFVPPVDESDDGADDFVPPVDESDDGEDDFVPPVDESDDGADDFVPPVDESDDGEDDFVPPVDESDDGDDSFIPPVDESDDGEDDFVPPVDESDDGEGTPTPDTEAPVVTNVVLSEPHKVIGVNDIGTTAIVVVTYNEVMDTNVNPALIFGEEVGSTVLLPFASTTLWSPDGKTFSGAFTVADANIAELKDIALVVQGAQDVAGNEQVTFAEAGFITHIDTISPEASITVTPGHDSIVAGNTAIISLAVNELLDEAPTITIGSTTIAAFPMEADEIVERVWRFFWAVNGALNGEYDISISGFDDVTRNPFVATTTVQVSEAPDVVAPDAPVILAIEADDTLINEEDAEGILQVRAHFDTELGRNVTPQFTFTSDQFANVVETLKRVNGFWSDDGKTYTVEYAVTDADVVAESVKVRVSASGNQEKDGVQFGYNIQKISEHLFSIDTIAPNVGFAYSPTHNPVHPGDSITVRMMFTEKLAAMPRIAWSGSDTGSAIPVKEDREDIEAWSFTWNVPENSDSGLVTFSVTGTDEARNAIGNITRNTRTIDSDTPHVVSVASTIEVISEDDADLFTDVSITFNKDMKASVIPEVLFTPGDTLKDTLVIESGEWRDARTYVVRARIKDVDVDTDVSVRISNAEDTFNTVMSTHVAPDVLTVDTIAPIPTLTYSPDRTLVAGDNVVIYAHFTEDITEVPTITISTPVGVDEGQRPMRAGVDPRTWTYLWVVPPGSQHNGTDGVHVNVRAVDAVGNTNLHTKNNTRTIENTGRDEDAPRIKSVSISDTKISEVDAGGEFTVRVVYDETMDTLVLPTVRFGRDTLGTLVQTDGAVWEDVDNTRNAAVILTYTIVDTDAEVRENDNDTPITVTVSGGTDLFGNAPENTVVKNNAFGIDMRAPQVVFTYEHVAGDSSIWPTLMPETTARVIATFDEAISGTPRVSISTSPDIGGVAQVGMQAGSSASQWTYDWVVPVLGTFDTAQAIVGVSGSDSFGNTVGVPSNRTRVIATEAVAPSDVAVTSLTVSDTALTEVDAGSEFVVRATFNTAMQQTTDVSFVFAPAVTALENVSSGWESDTVYVATYTVVDTDTEAVDPVDVSVLGGVSTRGDVHDASVFVDKFVVDMRAPSAALSFNPDKAAYTFGDTVRISAELSEEVDPESVRITLESVQGIIAQARMNIVGDRLFAYDAVMPEGSQHNGVLRVIVRAIDLAGNDAIAAGLDEAHTISNKGEVVDPDPEPEPPSGGGGGGGAGGGPVFASGLAPAYPNPLAILEFDARRVDDHSILVTWLTNFPATTQVYYGTESVPKLLWEEHFGYQFETVEKTDLVYEHSVLLTNIDANQDYFVRAESHLAGNFDVYSGEQEVSTTAGAIVLDDLLVDGTQCSYLTEFIGVNTVNTVGEVEKLQRFLIEYQGAELGVTGTFGLATENAVRRFQEGYRDSILDPWGIAVPTGYVYITTKKKINEIVCDTVLGLSSTERAEIDAYRARHGLSVGVTPEVGNMRVQTVDDIIPVRTAPAQVAPSRVRGVEQLIVPDATATSGARFILPGALFFWLPDRLRVW